MVPGSRKVSGWDWDPELEAYKAFRPGRFACACGNELDMPGYHACHKCGKIWNGYVIGNGGPNHEASADQYLVREIPLRPDVIVANRKLLGLDEEEEGDEFPSDHHPRTPRTPAAPTDWARRDHQNNYAPQQLKKRRRQPV